jgi:sec-independent protein translocase protein TatB
MFDIGFSELFLVAVVALLVLGPERLPKAARFAGLWVRRARAQWYSVKSEFERELADEELKRSLIDARDDLRNAEGQLRRGGESLRREFETLDPSHDRDRPAGDTPDDASDDGTSDEISHDTSDDTSDETRGDADADDGGQPAAPAENPDDTPATPTDDDAARR